MTFLQVGYFIIYDQNALKLQMCANLEAIQGYELR